MYSLGGGIRLRHLRSLRFRATIFSHFGEEAIFQLMEILWDPKLSKTAAAVADVVANALLHATGIYRNRRTVDEEEEGEDDKAVGRGRSFFFFCESLLQG